MIDLTCRLCAGSGVYDFSPSKETCGMCQGHGKFVDAKAMLVAAIELAKKQREPVIEVVMGLVLQGVDVRGKEPGERFKAAQAFNAPGHNLLRYGWDAWELYALHEGVSPELASLGRSVMREWHSHSWGRFSGECQDTLDTMRDAAIRNYEGNIRVIADIVLAHEARETEIEKGMFCLIVR